MDRAYFSGLGYGFELAQVGVALAGLALVVYRSRQLESAGDVVSVSWVRPVFQYGVAFCCAIALGTMFDNIFSSLLPRNAWVLLVWMLVWGAFGCFVAAMLRRKSVWVFKPCSTLHTAPPAYRGGKRRSGGGRQNPGQRLDRRGRRAGRPD